MANPKLIIEVRVNEGMDRSRSPHVPYTPEEIAADVEDCVANGASIIHYHARTPEGGNSAEPAMYVAIERAIRQRGDVITMPTLGAHMAAPPGRISHIVEMARDPATRPDCVPIDVVTTNMALFNGRTGDFEQDDRTYENTIADLKRLCDGVKAVGVKPVAMLWNIASIRVAEVLKRLGHFNDPLYCEIVLFEGMTLGFGHPSTVKGLYSMLEFLPRDDVWHWSAHGHTNTLGIAAGAIEAGGHVTVGLGDYHYPELGIPTNGQLVAFVAQMARAMGREVATVSEAREMIGMHR
jgi:3-keto-5-aminohexanoate cleavage enzyme